MPHYCSAPIKTFQLNYLILVSTFNMKQEFWDFISDTRKLEVTEEEEFFARIILFQNHYGFTAGLRARIRIKVIFGTTDCFGIAWWEHCHITLKRKSILMKQNL